MKYLDEKKIGYATGGGPVPIVPAAILYDLTVGGRPDNRPGADCGYKAAAAAKAGVEEGNVGAGAGATIGKMMGGGRAMKGGLGSTALVTTDGLIVGAIIAVNAVGSVVDPRTGKPIAGVRTEDGRALEDPFAIVRRGLLQQGPARGDDDWRRGDERTADQSPSSKDRDDGARRDGPRDRPLTHAVRRRYAVRAGDRRTRRRPQRRHHRIARG
jgi:hypothetical protein